MCSRKWNVVGRKERRRQLRLWRLPRLSASQDRELPDGGGWFGQSVVSPPLSARQVAVMVAPKYQVVWAVQVAVTMVVTAPITVVEAVEAAQAHS